MKKILILYFSGAGATLNSIKYMQTCINNITGCSAYIHSMENDLEENINNYDALIIGTPCYHCAPCLTLISFFQKLPKLINTKPTMVFNSYSLWSCNTNRITAKIIREKNIITIYDTAYRSPASDGTLITPFIKRFFEFEKNIYEKYFGYLKKRLNLQIKNTCLINIIGMLRGMLGNVINIVILLIAGVAIISGQMTIGNMVAFNTYLGSFFESIFKVMELNLDRQSVLISYKRMLELENQEEEDYNAGIELGFIENIICKNLNFGYEQEMILKELNITISGNGLYSIVGNNGCGKTTFLKLLERFYDKVSGEIFINNIEIEKYALSSLRKSIFYMAKEPFFMQDTILNNLRMGKDTVLKQEIIELCQKVGIHDEIMYLPEGYETVMEKGGENFSSGQKQKLGFVRVLLSQASLILLDEVTSDMDGIAEKKMCDLVEEMSQYSIVINVSHKPESLKRSKKIFLIENGKIVGSGLHCEMLRGYEQYRKMFGV